jgi:hypothetical protein
MFGHGLDNRDNVGMFQKNQFAIAVVIGKCAEWFWAQGNLGMQFTRRLQSKSH